MKNIIFIVFLLSSFMVIAQNNEQVDQLIFEGVALHDKGKYNEALAKYDEALILDKNNLIALAEKAITFNTLKRYPEAIEICKLAISKHSKDNDGLKNVYVTYANSLDSSGELKKALKIYDEGIKKYPDYYQLHFNKGIALVNAKQFEAAKTCFEESSKRNPYHGSSFYILGILNEQNRIASILSTGWFLVIENQTKRSETSLKTLESLMSKGLSKKEDGSITINIGSDFLSLDGKNKRANDFSATDMILSMAGVLEQDSINIHKTRTQKFISKFEVLCSSLSESKEGNHGYYWDYLAPYFIELKKNDMVEAFGYVVFSYFQDDDIIKYHDENSEKVEAFYDWSESYKWLN